MCRSVGRCAISTRPRASHSAAATTRSVAGALTLFGQGAVTVLELLARATGARLVAPHLAVLTDEGRIGIKAAFRKCGSKAAANDRGRCRARQTLGRHTGRRALGRRRKQGGLRFGVLRLEG